MSMKKNEVSYNTHENSKAEDNRNILKQRHTPNEIVEYKGNKYIADEKGILHKIRINKKGEVKVKPRWKDAKTGKAICNGGNTGYQVAVIEDENEETNVGSKITLRKIFVTDDGKPKISKSGKVVFSRGLVLPNDTKICRQICDEIMEIVAE